jgi:hypothetical protein
MEKQNLSICFARFHCELLQENKNKSWNVVTTPKHLFECLITYAKYEIVGQNLFTQLNMRTLTFQHPEKASG